MCLIIKATTPLNDKLTSRATTQIIIHIQECRIRRERKAKRTMILSNHIDTLHITKMNIPLPELGLNKQQECDAQKTEKIISI